MCEILIFNRKVWAITFSIFTFEANRARFHLKMFNFSSWKREIVPINISYYLSLTLLTWNSPRVSDSSSWSDIKGGDNSEHHHLQRHLLVLLIIRAQPLTLLTSTKPGSRRKEGRGFTSGEEATRVLPTARRVWGGATRGHTSPRKQQQRWCEGDVGVDILNDEQLNSWCCVFLFKSWSLIDARSTFTLKISVKDSVCPPTHVLPAFHLTWGALCLLWGIFCVFKMKKNGAFLIRSCRKTKTLPNA